MTRLRDSIVFIDEIQNYIKTQDKKNNRQLMELISLLKHYNNTLIATAPLSQYVNKGLEAQIDVWNMTHIADLSALKNGSKPKRIIQNTTITQSNTWSL